MELILFLAVVFCIFEPWSVRAKCKRTGCYKNHKTYAG